ncbi:MAG TPA: hypothetical protein VE954_37485 [Oligoflexus sp.]|nr:hypothetical protein [Oligoflexus sp.]
MSIKHPWLRYFPFGLCFISSLAGAEVHSKKHKAFASFGEDLKIFHTYMSKQDSGHIRLDLPSDIASATDEHSLALVHELVAFTNTVIERSRSSGMKSFSGDDLGQLVTPKPGSLLREYLQIVGNHAEPMSSMTLRDSQSVEEVCGSFSYPTQPAPWKTLTADQFGGDYVAYLFRLGFHTTPEDIFGGGFTKPKTYRPELCQWDSFRDHAYWKSDYKVLQIQIYDGMTPNGEPNPEINNYTWPYPTWPAYVAWWHVKN